MDENFFLKFKLWNLAYAAVFRLSFSQNKTIEETVRYTKCTTSSYHNGPSITHKDEVLQKCALILDKEKKGLQFEIPPFWTPFMKNKQ